MKFSVRDSVNLNRYKKYTWMLGAMAGVEGFAQLESANEEAL